MERNVRYSEVCMKGSECLKAAEPVLQINRGKDAQTHSQKKQNLQRSQAVILGNCDSYGIWCKTGI
jgi:hypothetical protein